MDLIAQSFQYNSDSILIQELFKVFESIKCSKGWKQSIKNISKGVLSLAVILCIHYQFRNPESLKSLLKWLLKFLCFRTFRFDMSKISEEYCIANRLKSMANAYPDEYQGIRLEFYTEGDQGAVTFAPFIHRKILATSYRLGKEDYQRHIQKTQEGITICRSLQGDFFIPKTLFPSKNYTKLTNILKNHLKISDLTESYRALGVLLDGEPGLGKTDFLDYFAKTNICKEVLKVDMTQKLKVDFSGILEQTFKNSKSGSLVILFDELDKYVDYRLRFEYRQTLERSTDEDQKEKKPREIPFEEFKHDFKQDFLYELLSLLETTYHEGGLVILFCSNNFDTIFEGIDTTHFISLKKRFVNVRFERCDAEEFKDYLRFLNRKFEGTKWHLPKERLEELLLTVRKDLSITYRDLCHMNIKASYNFEELIQAINEWEDEPVFREESLFTREEFLRTQHDKTGNLKPQGVNTKKSSPKLSKGPKVLSPLLEGDIPPPEFKDTMLSGPFENICAMEKDKAYKVEEPKEFLIKAPEVVRTRESMLKIHNMLNEFDYIKGVEKRSKAILMVCETVLDEGEEIMKREKFSSMLRNKLIELEHENKFPLDLVGEKDRIFNLLRQKYPVLK